ncbi:MAG: hypothetical protein A3K19_27845 [Lentisphaerae bacterium RIFOXYB12_FULL_65_16]|nr:MAG: hypothetical protein A3K18_17765 [Lentisphaerae bacterium RIFOXYA12_64_32]OGV88204.1 MAG: hypothetical protein A3K19_27845 [Lentisphaerae bacterium RIFOXYB12_FULL_65_16]
MKKLLAVGLVTGILAVLAASRALALGFGPMGNGADGPLTVAGGDTAYTDAVRAALTGAHLLGATTVTVADATGFAASDEVLIITMQDPELNPALNRVGIYETNRVQSVSGSTLTLYNPLANAFDGSGSIKHQVIRVPNYSTVTVNGTLTCNAWDGATGGVLFFRATGAVTVDVAGAIDASGKGYRGGTQYGGSHGGGQGGESFVAPGGTGGDYNSNNAQRGGAGGGASYANNYGADGWAGGGGGGTASYAGKGSAALGGAGGGGGGHDGCGGGGGHSTFGYGGNGYNGNGNGQDGGTSTSGNGGIEYTGGGGGGGGTYGTADLARLYCGSGGGSGGRHDGHAPGAGGAGGGILCIDAGSLDCAGVIKSNGADGGRWISSYSGGGGGGAGGSVLLRTLAVSVAGSVTATNGAGGRGWYADNYGHANSGGAGGMGRIRIDRVTLTGAGTVAPAAYAPPVILGGIAATGPLSVPDHTAVHAIQALIVDTQGSAITSAKLFYRVNGGRAFTEAVMTDTGDGKNFTANIPAQAGLALIEYYVQATDGTDVYTSPPDAPATLRSFSILGYPPRDVLATPSTSKTVVLTWTAPVNATNLVDYSIYRSEDPNFAPAPGNRIAEHVTALTYTDSDAGLLDLHTYYYKVVAVYSIGGTASTHTAAGMAGIVNDSTLTTINGYVLLEGQENHAGTLVEFNPISPSAVYASTTADALGYFEKAIENGVYDVAYSHASYQTYPRLTNTMLSVDTDLGTRTLDYLGNTVSGNVSGTWTGYYSVSGDITVPAGQALTIQPGTQVRFLGNYNLYVSGKLLAVGTAENGILFTSLPANQVKAGGQWGGIDFNDASDDTSMIAYATVEYAYDGIYWGEANATVEDTLVRYCSRYGLYINGDTSNPAVTDVEVTGCSDVAVYVYNGQPALTNVNSHHNSSYGAYYNYYAHGTLTGCKFNNNAGYGIRFYEWCAPTLDGCEVNDNSSWGIRIDNLSYPTFRNTSVYRNWGYGVGVHDDYGDWTYVRFENCIIEDNMSTGVVLRYYETAATWFRDCAVRNNRGNGIYMQRGCQPEISGCEITGNRSNGIHMDTDSGSYPNIPRISRNVIAYNENDGIYGYDPASPTILYNTIYGNLGDGIELNGSGTENIASNIIAGNAGYGLRATTPIATFEYNNLYENATGTISDLNQLPPGTGTFNAFNKTIAADIYLNISQAPLFVMSDANDFALQATSPCIDRGDRDIDDPDGTDSDMGALCRDNGGPHSLTITGYGHQTVSLSWSAVSAPENGTLTGYNVYYRVSPAGAWTLFGNTATTTATVTGLTNNTLYDFTVTGVFSTRYESDQATGHTASEKPGTPGITLSPVALNLNVGTGISQDVTVTNTGTRDLDAEFRLGRSAGSLYIQNDGWYLYKNSPTNLSGMSALTVECWLKRTKSGHFEFVSKHYREWSLYIDSGNQFGMYKGYQSDNRYQNWTSPQVVPINEWHHLAATWTGNTVSYYYDGTLVGQYDTAADTPIPDYNYQLRIGARSNESQWMNGYVAEVRVWNVCRTQAQIAKYKDVQMKGTETGLVGYWPLQANNNDLTANANHLSQNGTPPIQTTHTPPTLTKLPFTILPADEEITVAPGARAAAIVPFTFPNSQPTGTYAYTTPIWTNDPSKPVVNYEFALTYGTTVPSTPTHFIPVTPGEGAPEYTIIITQAQLDGVTLAVGDEIGVFDGELCVGAAKFGGTFNIVITCYGAVARASAGYTPGNAMVFKVFDADRSLEGTSNLTFSIGNGTFGYGAFSATGVTGTVYTVQSVPVTRGQFSLISFNKVPRYPAAPTVFGGLTNLEIVQDARGRAYIPAYSINSIGDIDFREGYYVFAAGSGGATVGLEGTTALPANWTYTLQPNQWNAVGFIGTANQNVTTAFPAALTDSSDPDIVIVQDDAGNAWVPGVSNTLGNLVPGKGYRIAISGSASTTFTYQASRGAAATPRGEPPSPVVFQPTPLTGLPYTILVASLSIDGAAPQVGTEVGVFDGDLCVGAAVCTGEDYLQVCTWQAAAAQGLAGFTAGHAIQYRVAVPGSEGSALLTPTSCYARGDGTFGSSFYSLVGLATGEAPTVEMVQIVDPTETKADVTNQRLVHLFIQASADTAPGTQWLIAESATEPAASDARWVGVKPTSYQIQGNEGSVDLYVWVKDAGGRISLLHSGSHKTIVLDLGLTFAVHLTNAEIDQLSFGVWNYATNGFDANLDEEAPVRRNGLVNAWLQNNLGSMPGLQNLLTDIRPVGDLTRWCLCVEIPDGAAGTSLSFTVPALPPGQCMLLQRLANGETPVGAPIQVFDGVSITVAKGGVYEIALGTPIQATLTLNSGWNLVSIPCMTTATAAQLLTAIGDGAPWAWDGDKMVPVDAAAPLNPEAAYWVKSLAGGVSQAFSGITADGVVALAAGWNLVSVPGACAYPDDPAIVGCIWRWAPTQQGYCRVANNEQFQPGCGYWIYVSSDTVLDFTNRR